MEAGRGEVLVNMFSFAMRTEHAVKLCFFSFRAMVCKKGPFLLANTKKNFASRYELPITPSSAVADPLAYSRRSWRFLR